QPHAGARALPVVRLHHQRQLHSGGAKRMMTQQTQPTHLTAVESRLKSLREQIDRARQTKARAEATLEQLEAQRREALAELERLGVTEDSLQVEIERLQAQIDEKLAEAERLLRGV